jgi:hypothetical protein
MKNASKMRMIPERDDIFGSDPKLQFNFFWLTVHGALINAQTPKLRHRTCQTAQYQP